MTKSVPVIDLFAGPGGLGEGFASLIDNQKKTSLFQLRLSIEKDDIAHRTLLLRAFYRQFRGRSIPETYYEYLRGKISREALFTKHKREFERAEKEALQLELGKESYGEVKQLIKKSLSSDRENAWVLIGGPPCQAYSLAGRSRMSKLRREDIEAYELDERHTLYREYLRIIADHRPPVFVMENVKGILSSTVGDKRIFHQILSDLQKPDVARAHYDGTSTKGNGKTYNIFPLVRGGSLFSGFEPADYVIEAEHYGIPQARHRVILLGIRSDLHVEPGALKTLPKVLVKDVISDLPKLRSTISRGGDSRDMWIETLQDIRQFPWFAKISRNGNERLGTEISSVIDQIDNKSLSTGAEFIRTKLNIQRYREWYYDERLGGVCNHSARGHMKTDLHRYLFASCFARAYGKSPELKDFPKPLLPDHKNVNDAMEGGYFSDRFRVQLFNKPSSTITSHISKDGHYYIHPDPVQCRSLTVREAARLQTFPDNYFFEGPRTAQYHQVGNAVPPYLATQIARIVYDVLEQAGIA